MPSVDKLTQSSHNDKMEFHNPPTNPWDYLTGYTGPVRALDIKNFPWTSYSSIEFPWFTITRANAVMAVNAPLDWTICRTKVKNIPTLLAQLPEVTRYLHFSHSPIGRRFYPVALNDEVHQWFEDNHMPYGVTARARGHLIILFKELSHAAHFKLVWM